MTELNPEVVNKLNELIGLDRSLVSNDESCSELVNKLRNKIDALRDNFTVNMPLQYSNEGEFGKLCAKIEGLSSRYASLKADYAKMRAMIDEYKRKTGSSECPQEDELRKLIVKSISVQRYLVYIRTLIELDDFR